MPSWIEKKTLSHSELNVGSRWRGVKGSQLDVVTCEIEIPRNQSSVKMGRYFEVKYLIDIGVCTPAAYVLLFLVLLETLRESKHILCTHTSDGKD